MWTQRASDPAGILRHDESRAVGRKNIGKSFEAIYLSTPFKFDKDHYRVEPGVG
jgi:hypothetical protein